MFFACFSSFVSFISAQGELEMSARAQGRFQTVLACKAREQKFMYRVKYYSVGGSLFLFCNSQHNVVNSFLRDLIYTDLHGCLVQQHPCSKCQFTQWDHCNYWLKFCGCISYITTFICRVKYLSSKPMKSYVNFLRSLLWKLFLPIYRL